MCFYCRRFFYTLNSVHPAKPTVGEFEITSIHKRQGRKKKKCLANFPSREKNHPVFRYISRWALMVTLLSISEMHDRSFSFFISWILHDLLMHIILQSLENFIRSSFPYKCPHTKYIEILWRFSTRFSLILE